MNKPKTRKRVVVDLALKARLFRGLGDQSRLMIIDLLRSGPKCVYEIADATGLSQPNTSAHLGCLEDCGLVEKERRGKFIFYRIAHDEAEVLLNQADAILARVGDQIFRCTRYEQAERKTREVSAPKRTSEIGKAGERFTSVDRTSKASFANGRRRGRRARV